MILYQSPRFTRDLNVDQFELSFWQKNADAICLKGGRGASLKISLEGKDYVLRRYLRGGLMAKISYDMFFWLGLKRTRPYQEHKILQYAFEQGLAVPECVAYCVTRYGLVYRAAIMTQYLPNNGTLASYLRKHALNIGHWQQLAQLVRQMHQLSINHADLNADNILITEKANGLHFSVIDFDKARIEKTREYWPQSNIKRLRRSLLKINPKYFNAQAQQYFNQSFDEHNQ